MKTLLVDGGKKTLRSCWCKRYYVADGLKNNETMLLKGLKHLVAGRAKTF